jgi:hypothetical protein
MAIRRPWYHWDMSDAERRDALRYQMLVALDAASGVIDFRETIPGAEMLELRTTASWLVENMYAVWSGGGVLITDRGRAVLASVETDDRRAPDQ